MPSSAGVCGENIAVTVRILERPALDHVQRPPGLRTGGTLTKPIPPLDLSWLLIESPAGTTHVVRCCCSKNRRAAGPSCGRSWRRHGRTRRRHRSTMCRSSWVAAGPFPRGGELGPALPHWVPGAPHRSVQSARYDVKHFAWSRQTVTPAGERRTKPDRRFEMTEITGSGSMRGLAQ